MGWYNEQLKLKNIHNLAQAYAYNKLKYEDLNKLSDGIRHNLKEAKFQF